MRSSSGLSYEYQIVSRFSGRLNSAVLNLRKEIAGYDRSREIDDDRILENREFIANVLEGISQIINGTEPEVIRDGLQKGVPYSVVKKLKEEWPSEVSQNIKKLEPIIAKLRNPDVDLESEDLEFIGVVLKAASEQTSEVYRQSKGR